jgi:hypothetical protein
MLVVGLAAMTWAMAGDINIGDPWSINSILSSPLVILDRLLPYSRASGEVTTTQTVSPIEARTAIAGGIIVALVLAWMLGDARFSTGRRVTSRDADGWEGSFGRAVALSARSSHVQATRLYLPRPVTLPSPVNLLSLLFKTVPVSILTSVPRKGARVLADWWKRKAEVVFRWMVVPGLLVLDLVSRIVVAIVRA